VYNKPDPGEAAKNLAPHGRNCRCDDDTPDLRSKLTAYARQKPTARTMLNDQPDVLTTETERDEVKQKINNHRQMPSAEPLTDAKMSCSAWARVANVPSWKPNFIPLKGDCTFAIRPVVWKSWSKKIKSAGARPTDASVSPDASPIEPLPAIWWMLLWMRCTCHQRMWN